MSAKVGVYAAVFAEGEFEDLVQLDSVPNAMAFCMGYRYGGEKYGAGGAMAFVLPDEEASMRRHIPIKEAMKALNAWERLL